MGVLPGSHLEPLHDMYDAEGNRAGAMNDVDVETLDLDATVRLRGPAGSVTVHNCCTVRGTIIGGRASQRLEVDGRTMHGAPDRSRKGPPTIFGSQHAT